jgi:hypothetical protein
VNDLSLYAEVSEKDFPLVKVRFTGHKANAENFDLFLNELREIYRHQVPLAIVFDARKATFPALTYQKKMALWMSSHQRTINTYCKGTSYVIANAVIRKGLQLIFSIQKQTVPYQVFADESEAIKWTRTQLFRKPASD